MITRIKSERIILADRIIGGYVYFEDGVITAVTSNELAYDSEYDAGSSYVSPGFIDIHTHGAGGYDFTESTEAVINACNFHLMHGTTSIAPTISAAPMDAMTRAVEYVREARRSPECKPYIIGAHMEGPYLSAEQCGAQRPDFITPPSKEEYTALVEKYGDAIARITYAPENDKDGEFARFMTSHGIVVSAGHTNAIGDEMKVAADNGCKLITHLYSCTSTVTRDKGFRRLGVIESAYLDDDMYVEIIADGRHLPPDLIKLILKIKGTDRVALITDSLAPAGTDAKTCKGISGEYIILDGVARLPDLSAFAGSIATADRLIRVMTGEADVPLCDAVKMLTEIPARIMGLNKGKLAVGYDADIIVFDEGINIGAAFVGGKKV